MPRQPAEQGNVQLGQLMLELRKSYNQKQESTARSMSIKDDYLRDFEHGKRMPSHIQLRKFSETLGLTPQDQKRLFEFYSKVTLGKDLKVSLPLSQTPLQIGTQETEFLLIDGVGDEAIPPNNVKIFIDKSPAKIPSHLQFFYDTYNRKIAQRKKRGGFTPYNGNIFSVKSIETTRTPGSEIPQWSVLVSRNKYYQSMSMLTNLDTPYEHESRTTTLREEYFSSEHFDPKQPPNFVNNFGVSLTVHLKEEDLLIFVERGVAYVGTELLPKCFGSSIGESFHPIKDKFSTEKSSKNQSVSLTKCAIRGAREELRLRVAPENLSFLSLGYDRHYCQYGFVGLVSVDLSLSELRVQAARAKDKEEVHEICAIPARPVDRAFKELFRITHQRNRLWPPFPLGTLLLALQHFNGDEYDDYDHMLRNNPQKIGTKIPYGLIVPPLSSLTGRNL